MELHRTDEGFALYKEKTQIGFCALTPAAKGAAITSFGIEPQWRRKGYGSYLLKEALRAYAKKPCAPTPDTTAKRLPYLPPRCPPMPQSLRSGQSSALRQKAGSWCAAARRT